jgi:4-hydroxy-tetrahydrodipicolinate reductase
VILVLVAAGYHVVTTCEELSRPDSHVKEAIRTSAVSDDRRVIATGANPGFVMDRLVVAVAGGSRSIRRIDVSRRVDTSTRRGPLVAKTGRGMSQEEFEVRVSARRLGHVGLVASAKLIARALGWPTHDVSDTIEPVVDESGVVSGLHQVAELRTPEGGVLHLDLVMAWEVADPGDVIVIDGSPPIRVEIPGGYPGDLGTTAEVVNAIGRYNQVPPGFYRSIDLPLRFS